MSNQIDVTRIDDTVYARVVGLGSFNNAGPLRGYVDAAIQEGVRDIVVDLDQCTGMDSTFMGTLMGFICCPLDAGGQEQSLSDSEVNVTVLNLNPITKRALESLGLQAMLDVRSGHIDVPTCKMRRLDDDHLNPARRTRLIREAHEHLIDIDERNRATFAPFLEMLKKEGDA